MAIAVRRPLAALVVIASAMLLSACGINTIPTYEEQAKAAWSEVLNQYQRRADLIPNLVETVKGYAKQEETVLTEVTEARAKATQMQVPADILTDPAAFQKFQEAQGQIGAALSRLLAITEAYPDLKSNQNFLALQSQLGRHGEPHRGSAPRLHRGGQALQYRARDFPGAPVGLVPLLRQEADGDLHHRAGEDADAGGQVQLTMKRWVHGTRADCWF